VSQPSHVVGCGVPLGHVKTLHDIESACMLGSADRQRLPRRASNPWRLGTHCAPEAVVSTHIVNTVCERDERMFRPWLATARAAWPCAHATPCSLAQVVIDLCDRSARIRRQHARCSGDLNASAAVCTSECLQKRLLRAQSCRTCRSSSACVPGPGSAHLHEGVQSVLRACAAHPQQALHCQPPPAQAVTGG